MAGNQPVAQTENLPHQRLGPGVLDVAVPVLLDGPAEIHLRAGLADAAGDVLDVLGEVLEDGQFPQRSVCEILPDLELPASFRRCLCIDEIEGVRLS
jgi:hypothetical protein